MTQVTITIDASNKEDSLGNPLTDGQVLSSLTDGTRSWVDASGGQVDSVTSSDSNVVVDNTDPANPSVSAPNMAKTNVDNNFSEDQTFQKGIDFTTELLGPSWSNTAGFKRYTQYLVDANQNLMMATRDASGTINGVAYYIEESGNFTTYRTHNIREKLSLTNFANLTPADHDFWAENGVNNLYDTLALPKANSGIEGSTRSGTDYLYIAQGSGVGGSAGANVMLRMAGSTPYGQLRINGGTNVNWWDTYTQMVKEVRLDTATDVGSSTASMKMVVQDPTDFNKLKVADIPSGGGGATDLDGLSDVTIFSPQGGDILTYNGFGTWLNVPGSALIPTNLKAVATLGGPLNLNQRVAVTTTVFGAVLGDAVVVNYKSGSVPDKYSAMSAYVSAADTVIFYVFGVGLFRYNKTV